MTALWTGYDDVLTDADAILATLPPAPPSPSFDPRAEFRRDVVSGIMFVAVGLVFGAVTMLAILSMTTTPLIEAVMYGGVAAALPLSVAAVVVAGGHYTFRLPWRRS